VEKKLKDGTITDIDRTFVKLDDLGRTEVLREILTEN